jgi:hypothetical protein
VIRPGGLCVVPFSPPAFRALPFLYFAPSRSFPPDPSEIHWVAATVSRGAHVQSSCHWALPVETTGNCRTFRAMPATSAAESKF